VCECESVKCGCVGLSFPHDFRQPTDLSVGGNHKTQPMALAVGAKR
jgi:hypothetical protein